MAKGDNLTTKYNLDVSEFKKAINDAIKSIKQINATFKANTAGMDNWKKSSEGIEAKLKQLADTLIQQNKKVEAYRNQLKVIQNYHEKAKESVSELETALKKAKERYGENSKKVKTLSQDLSKAEKAEDKFKDRIDELNRIILNQSSDVTKTKAQIEKWKAALSEVLEEEQKASSSVGKLTTEIQKQEKNLDKLKYQYKNSVLEKGKDAESTRKLGSEIQKLSTEITNNKSKMQALDEQTDKLDNSFNDINKATEKAKEGFTVLKGVLSNLLTDGIYKVAHGLKSAFDTAVGYESAFTNVRKTVDGSEKDFQKLNKQIRDMAKVMPESASDIAEVASVAGQLGIKVNDIADFTEVMVKLGDSTNVTSEEAGTMLARFSNITNMDSSQYSKLASTIVDLGNNTATSEKEIMKMAMRIASTGTTIGLSIPDVIAFSAGLSSMGLKAEMGGTAFSKLMINMSTAVKEGGAKLDGFAKVAGQTSEQFAKSFGKDATGAILTFLKGLRSSKKTGKDTIDLLSDLGIKEVRLRETLINAAKASDKMDFAVKRGNKAWKENIALDKEANQRYQTTESRIQIMKNNFSELALTIFDKVEPAVKGFVDGLKDLANNEGALKALAVSAGALISAFAVSKIWEITKAFSGAVIGLKNIALGTAAATVATEANTVATVANTTATNVGTVATNLFNAAWKANPLGVVVGIVGALAAGIWGLVEATKAFTPELDKQIEKNQKVIDKYKNLNDELKNNAKSRKQAVDEAKTEAGTAELLSEKIIKLAGVEKKSNSQKQTMKTLVKQLNDLVPKLNLKYDEEKDKLNKTTEAIRLQIDAQKDLLIAKAREAQIEEIAKDLVKRQDEQPKLIEAREKAQKNYNELLERQNELMRDAVGRKNPTNLLEQIAVAKEVEKAKEAFDGATQAVKDNKSAMKSLDKQLDTLPSKISNLKKVAKFDDMIAKAGLQGSKLVEKFSKEIEKGKMKPQQAINKIQSITKYDALVAQAETAGVKIPKSIRDGILNNEVSVKNAINSVNRLIEFQKAFKEAGIAGTKIPKELASKIISGKITVTNAKKQMNNWIEFQKAIDKAGLAGAKIPEKLRKGILYGATSVRGAVQSIRDIVANEAKEVGNELARGMASGFKTSAETVMYPTMDDFAGRVIQRLRKKTEINSPSKKTIPIGEGLGEGIAVGLRKITKSVLVSVNKLANSTLSEAKTSFTNSGFDQVEKNIVDSYTTGIKKYVANSKTAINNLMQTSVNSYSSKIDKKINAIKEKTDKQTQKLNNNIKNSKGNDKKALQKQLTSLKKSAEKEIEVLKKQKDNYKKAAQANIKAYNEALKEFGDKAKETIAVAMDKVNDTFQSKYDELISKQKNLQDKMSTFGELFSINDNGTIHIEDIKKQSEIITQYAKSLNTLKNKVSSSLFDYVAGLNIDDAQQYMDYLLSLSKADLKAYDNAYKNKLNISKKYSEDIYKKDLQSLTKQYNNAVDNALKNVKGKLEKMGENSIKGLIKGMQSQSKSLNKEIKAITDNIIKAFKKELKIKSPSQRLADEVGAFLPSGVGQGAVKNLKPLLKSMEVVRNTVVNSLDKIAVPAPSFATAGRAVSNTTSIVNNYNQTINAPKQPSRLDLYRQSKNLLNWTKRG